MEIIMATGNDNKVREIMEMLGDSDISIISMKKAGINIDIDENGTSFEENAKIKAEAVRDASGKITIADDSGLEIDYLGGEPGIYSARYMGEDTSYDIKNAALIKRLEGVPCEERTARFVCAMAIAYPDKDTEVFRGEFEGRIAYEPAGENGFGYDPILFLPQYGKTSAQISPQEKNAISHRGKALRMVIEELKKNEKK